MEENNNIQSNNSVENQDQNQDLKALNLSKFTTNDLDNMYKNLTTSGNQDKDLLEAIEQEVAKRVK